jgi:UDP-N-acetylglucosamine 2-epimerase (non-hydrolysing)
MLPAAGDLPRSDATHWDLREQVSDLGASRSLGRPEAVATCHVPRDAQRSWLAERPVLPPKSIAVVIGTRPEAIKMAEVIRLLGPALFLIHTGQHYSESLWADVVKDVAVPEPDLTLAVGGQVRSSQIGEAITELGRAMHAHGSLGAVLVHGDTNTTVAGALAANAEGLPLFHVEAGLRSHDRRMPEEHNRVVADHLADLCFAPTEVAYANLANEGIGRERVYLTGNTIVEAVRRLLPPPGDRLRICRRFGVKPGEYVLATLHRPENSDNPFRLATILGDLRTLPVPVLAPLHPRTRNALSVEALAGVSAVDPVRPRDFLALLAESRLVVTDSGGVQEEVAVLDRRALVVRQSTERPESLGRWSELVEPGVGLRRLGLQMLSEYQPYSPAGFDACPYGDGYASARVVSAIAAAAGFSRKALS